MSAVVAADLAREAERAGAAAMYFPEVGHVSPPGVQVSGRDPMLLSAAALEETKRLVAGPAVIATPFRSPRHLALTAATINERSGGRLVLGVGVSHRGPVEALGYDYPPSPLGHVESIVADLREHSMQSLSFGGGFPVVVGALGDRMLQLAARCADGIVLNWLTPHHAGRLISTVLDDSPASRSILLVRVGPREAIANDARTYQQNLPNYRRHFQRQGMTSLDAVVDGTCIPSLDPEVVADRLRDYADAGVTTTCLYPTGMSSTEVIDLLRGVGTARQRVTGR